MIWLQLGVVLSAIYFGARYGGIALGLMAMIGLSVLVFIFGLPPGGPPGTVLAIVMAVVTAAATMQAAGGMDYLVEVAGRLLKARPQWITFVAPLVAYVFTFCAGTGHVAYSILPVISETALKAGVRPERPMSISVIASQTAITASPISAATVALVALLEPQGVTLARVLMIAVPATLAGVILGALSVFRKGKELADDPGYLALLEKGLVDAPQATKPLEGEERRRARRSVLIFLAAALAVVLFGMFEFLRPKFPSVTGPGGFETVKMPVIIQLIMYCAGAMIIAFCGAKPTVAARSPVATAGLIAVISIIGLGWLGTCFYEGNRELINSALSGTAQSHPWVFSFALFGLSVVLFSQASTVSTLMPVGIAPGLGAHSLIAMFPAVNGYFFLPTYATSIAAASFDRSGTTRLGRYVLDHSFMVPGLVTTASAIGIGFLLSAVL
jgi:anaerobic C4-dicarboxylate transporter-like protein